MAMKPESKFWIGMALMGVGIALGAGIFVMAALQRAELKAADRAAAVAAQEAEQRLAIERRDVEKKVLRAAALQPLNAALENHVDRPTVIDLFENEDWWQPYRDDFAGARLILKDSLLAAWGEADLGAQDAEVVKAARQQRVGSAQVTAGGQRYLLAAARMAAIPDQAPVLVLVRRSSAAPAVISPPAGAPIGLAGNPVSWMAAGAFGLMGLASVVSSRKRRGPDPRTETGSVPGFMPGAASAPWEPIIEIDEPSPSRPPSRPVTQESFVQRPSPSGRTVRATPAAAAVPPAPPPVPAVASAPRGAVRLAEAEAEPAPESAPPPAFGRYRVLGRLAEGGMSEIYTAETSGVEGFTRTFVLKRLRPALAHDRDAVANFIDEARTQSTLVHSNIVPVFDFGMVDDEYFMTQEYIIGRDLTRLILRHHDLSGQPIDPRVAYYVAYETLQALSYAHSKVDKSGIPLNIVHRDVSPGNIIVSLQGEVKLSDFGIARANRRVTITQVGLVKGNTDFMSPEQARGQPVDARSDLFSLGEVLYYALTNELLYGGDNDLDVLFKAASGPSADHMRRFRSLPSPAGQILEKALAFEPEARFQSAAEFAEALAPHTSGGKAQLMSLMLRLFGKELRHRAA